MKVGDLVIVPDNLVSPALVLDILASTERKREEEKFVSSGGDSVLIMFQRTGYKMWVDMYNLKVIS